MASVFRKHFHREHLSSFYLLHIFLADISWVCLFWNSCVQHLSLYPLKIRTEDFQCGTSSMCPVHMAAIQPHEGLPGSDTRPVPRAVKTEGPTHCQVGELATATRLVLLQSEEGRQDSGRINHSLGT